MSCIESMQSLRPGGEMMKSNCCIIRTTIVLGAATLVTLGLLLARTKQPFSNQSISLSWQAQSCGPESLLPPQTVTRSSDALQQPPPMDPLKERGVGLLHSWTDAELFVRAISVNRSTVGKTNLTSAPPKIAFLFLIQRDLPLAKLWNKFFKGHEGLYNVYVHMWPLRLSAMPKSMGVFWGRVIPSEEGKRLTPGLIADARRLLANALLDDPTNEWFAMVSESCIPIHGFRHIYNSMASTNKTFMEMTSKHSDMPNRYKARGDNAMKPEIQFSQFRVGSQFWVMRRKHALMTVRDQKYWNKFNHPCLPRYVNCFPEEHYFATLLNILDPGGTTTYSVTLVDWSRPEWGGHPRRFLPKEINRELIKKFQQLQNGRFLFVRKFHRDCLRPLLDIADAILDH